MDPEEAPQPGIPVRLPVVAVDVVAWCPGRTPGAIGQMEGRGGQASQLQRAAHSRSPTAGLQRPAVSLQAEDVRLLAEGDEEVEPYPVAREGLDQRHRRVAMDGAAEELGGILVGSQSPLQGLFPVVQSHQPLDLLNVGHLGGPDHFVLVLEEEGEIPVRRARDRVRVYGPARFSSQVLPRRRDGSSECQGIPR